jgi:hypothetical protein
MDLTAEALVVGVDCGANDAFDPISTWRLDGQFAAALFQCASEVNHIATVDNGVMAKPLPQWLAIGHGRLTEAEQPPDLNAMAYERAFTNVEHARRLCRNSELLGNRSDVDCIDLEWIARKTAVVPEEEKQGRERQPAVSRLGPDAGAVGDAQGPWTAGTAGGLHHQGLEIRLQCAGTHGSASQNS